MNAKNMVSAVQGEDSSSANVNYFCITDICSASLGLIKFINSEGAQYFSRELYFKYGVLKIIEDNLGQPLKEEAVLGFLSAVRRYAAECAAMKYLNRAEHSRFQLETKLKKKGFSVEEYSVVFDYLMDKGFLNDGRYARSWLNTRRLTKKEGRHRLASELAARGIEFKTVKIVLDDFFLENSEEEICKKALAKQLKKGISGQKLFYSLQRMGFSVHLIKMCLEDKNKEFTL